MCKTQIRKDERYQVILNFSLIYKALRRRLTIPEMEDFIEEIDRIFPIVKENEGGKLGMYAIINGLMYFFGLNVNK